jgi:hypothetical protein
MTNITRQEIRSPKRMDVQCNAVTKKDHQCSRHRVSKSHFCRQHTASMLDNKEFYLVHMTTLKALQEILMAGHLTPRLNHQVFFTLVTPDNKIDFTINSEKFMTTMRDRVYLVFPVTILNDYEYTWWPHWTGGAEHYRMDRAYTLRQNMNLIYNFLKFDNCYMEESNMPCNEFMIQQSVSLASMAGIYYPMRLMDEYVCIGEKHKEYARFVAFRLGRYLQDRQIVHQWSEEYPQYRFIFNTKNSFLKKYVKVSDGRFVMRLPYRVLGNDFWSSPSEIEVEEDFQEREYDRGYNNIVYKSSDCVH